MFSESLTNNTGLSRKSARCWCAKGSRPTGFARDGTGIDTVNGNGRRSSA